VRHTAHAETDGPSDCFRSLASTNANHLKVIRRQPAGAPSGSAGWPACSTRRKSGLARQFQM